MAGVAVLLESEATPKSKSPADLQKFWQKELAASEKRLRKFTKQGNQINNRYLDWREGGGDGNRTTNADMPFRLNLFHTNVSTLSAMLYGSTPKIDVSREHQDPDDDVARVASLLYQRILEADASESGGDLSTTLKAALQDRLLPGLGTARVRYEVESRKETQLDPDTMTAVEVEVTASEDAPVDYVHWQDFRWGWARTWTETPWLGYRSYLTKEAATARFGEKKAASLTYINQMPTGDTKNNEGWDKDQKNNVQKAEIWEFWQKNDKRVYWYNAGCDLILDSQEDPLRLDGFWPSPMPMMANLTTSLFIPRADFVISQDLYNEIDVLQSRISIITRAVKVVGVYDKGAGESVGRMLKEGQENQLIPVDNWAMFAESGGLKGVIDWFPVEDVVQTLQTLTTVRDQTIELLYQVTGMSDIMRGANTDQYTSDGTQQLKAKMGSIRVQALQDDFARFASDLDQLKAEVISKHFDQQTIATQSNAQFLPQADLDKVLPALQLMKSPDIKWRINIRPESIAMVDYAQLKAERSEFLTAMATYIQSASGAAQAMPGSLPILMEMMKWGMAGFKGANYMEGMMDAAIDLAKKDAEQKKGQDPEAEAAKKAAEMEMQRLQKEHENEMQKIQTKGQVDMATQNAKAQATMQQEMADHRNKMQQEQLDHQNEMRKLREEFMADMQLIKSGLDADLKTEQAQSAYAIEEEIVQHANTMTEMGADHAVAMTEKKEDHKNAVEASSEPGNGEE